MRRSRNQRWAKPVHCCTAPSEHHRTHARPSLLRNARNYCSSFYSSTDKEICNMSCSAHKEICNMSCSAHKEICNMFCSAHKEVPPPHPNTHSPSSTREKLGYYLKMLTPDSWVFQIITRHYPTIKMCCWGSSYRLHHQLCTLFNTDRCLRSVVFETSRLFAMMSG